MAGVDADPHAELRPSEVALQPRRRPYRAGRAREGGEERVALRVHDDSVFRFEGVVDEPSVLREQRGVRLGADAFQELGRALDVGEDEGHGAGRELTHAPSLAQQ